MIFFTEVLIKVMCQLQMKGKYNMHKEERRGRKQNITLNVCPDLNALDFVWHQMRWFVVRQVGFQVSPRSDILEMPQSRSAGEISLW